MAVANAVPAALWKLTIKPKGKKDPNANAFAFCRERGIVGIGWPFDRTPTSGEDAIHAYRDRYSGKLAAAVNIFATRANVGDHVWVYGDRTYHVCRLSSDWKYADGGVWDDHDIHNYRSAEWVSVPIPLVPGIVKRKLTMYGTAQKITGDSHWCGYSAYLFENALDVTRLEANLDLADMRDRLLRCSVDDILSVLGADETEDVVAILLQEVHGWRLIKSTAYPSRRTVECEFRRLKGDVSETAYMQVKSGNTVTLDPNAFDHYLKGGRTWVYLFSSARNPYSAPASSEGMCLLTKEEVVDFLRSNLALMPLDMLLKLDLWARDVVA